MLASSCRSQTQVARAPQKPALLATQPRSHPLYPAPAQAPVTESQELHGNNNKVITNDNNNNNNEVIIIKGRGGWKKKLKHYKN